MMFKKSSVKNDKLKSQNLSEVEKKPPWAQIFRYFRYENRNNNVN